MPYLMHIGFDSNYKLSRRIYYLSYKGIQYKLIQNNPRKWQDVLLTIIDNIGDEEAQDHAFQVAGEFLSALSWELGSKVKLSNIGGSGAKAGFTLRRARCSHFTFPEIPFGGYTIGGKILQIPHIENEKQKTALTLFREAKSSNNTYLSFLFYWQILEVGNMNAANWATKAFRNRVQNRLYIDNHLLSFINTSKPIGQYLEDDCRHAIAHIRRRPGGTSLKLDSPKDITRLGVSTRIVEIFARLYIKEELKLTKKLYLVKKGAHGFPFYASEEEIWKGHYSSVRERNGNLFGSKKGRD